MSITLKTHREDQLLELSNFQKDSYVYGFTLSVSSGNFSATVPASHYDTSWLDAFYNQLVQMEGGSAGEALLEDEQGNNVEFKLDHLGHLKVRGRLIHYMETTQELNFAFITDQTCLKPFILDLNKVLAKG